MSKNFRNVYALDDAEYQEILDNELKRLKFSYRLLRQVLFGEETIPLVDNALEKRMEERKEILEARRQAEVEIHKEKSPFEKYTPE